ncbi:hypothetical protein KW792_00120 [Candidatus Saccharibacteria bacterium]|nr:hypothetical protein [Candidatus Saccharibacteria bacterium]
MTKETDNSTLPELNQEIMGLVEGHEIMDVPGAYQRAAELTDSRRILLSYMPEKTFVSVTEETRKPGSVKVRGRKWSSLNPLDETLQERRVLRSDGQNRAEHKKRGLRERDVRRIARLLEIFKETEDSDG